MFDDLVFIKQKKILEGGNGLVQSLEENLGNRNGKVLDVVFSQEGYQK